MKKLIMAVLISACAGFLFAYVYGGTNLGFMGYPEFSVPAPSAPYGYEVSEYKFTSYRDEVENYINQAEEYIENGNNDIQRISEAQESAINKANRAVDEFNSWARRISITKGW